MKKANGRRLKQSQIQQAAWYKANRKRVLAHHKVYRENNLERERIRKADWYKANRERVLAHQKKICRANRKRLGRSMSRARG